LKCPKCLKEIKFLYLRENVVNDLFVEEKDKACGFNFTLLNCVEVKSQSFKCPKCAEIVALSEVDLLKLQECEKKSVECAGILHPGSNGSRFAVDLECGGVVPLEWRHRKVKVLMVLDE